MPFPTGLVVEGYTPEQVEEVRMVVRLLPVFFTTILYWTVYAQMGTFFIMQARTAAHLLPAMCYMTESECFIADL